MEETRYFTKAGKKEISTKFKIPVPTLKGWEKERGEIGTWRGYLYDQLSMFIEMEEHTEAQIKQLFTKKELMALWGSLKGTMITKDLIFMENALVWGFEDYCRYETMEAGQFTDDLDTLAKTVGKKLASLDLFSKFVLVEYIKSKRGEEDIFEQKNKDGIK